MVTAWTSSIHTKSPSFEKSNNIIVRTKTTTSTRTGYSTIVVHSSSNTNDETDTTSTTSSTTTHNTPKTIHHHDKSNDPCWQDIWNYDCAMSNIYSTSFVAYDWLKSMPCAAGLADCDTPEELKIPGNPIVGTSGLESVDVMSFLNIQRPKSLVEKKP